MKRCLKLILPLALVTAGVWIAELTFLPPTAAYALGGNYTTSENNAFVTSVMSDINALPTLPPSATNPATGVAYTTAEEFSGMTTARMAGGFGVPALNALGVISIGGASIYTAYEVGNYFRAKISGDTAATVTFTPSWSSYCSSTTPGDNGSTTCAAANSSWSPVNFGGWGVQQKGGIGPTTPGLCAQGCWVLGGSNGAVCAGGVVTANCTGAGFTGDNNANNTASSYSIYTNNPTLTNIALNTSAGSTDCKAVGACAFYWRTFAQMRQVIQQETCSDACYAAATTKDPAIIPSAANGATANSLQNAESQCGGFLGSTVGTKYQEACSAALNYAVNPACNTDGSNCVGGATAGATVTIPGTVTVAPFAPFVIPEPEATETYSDYLERLRERGWVGTATVTTVLTDSTLTGPRGVVSVEDTTASLGPDSITAWPDNPFKVPAATDALTIRRNSDSAPVVVPGSGGCTCPPIDFSPLQALTVGSSFPFGALNWIESAMGSPTPTAFSTTLTLPAPVGSFPIDTSNTWWETTGRGIAYPVMEALISLAFFYVFATRILGMGKADED